MAAAKVRLPARGPTPDQIADRERWEAMTSASMSSVQAAAERWRTGLAAFVTLITGGLLIKGPQAASDLTTGWRIVITLLAGAGLVLAVVGLWLALRAAAGAPGSVSYPEHRPQVRRRAPVRGRLRPAGVRCAPVGEGHHGVLAVAAGSRHLRMVVGASPAGSRAAPPDLRRRLDRVREAAQRGRPAVPRPGRR